MDPYPFNRESEYLKTKLCRRRRRAKQVVLVGCMVLLVVLAVKTCGQGPHEQFKVTESVLPVVESELNIHHEPQAAPAVVKKPTVILRGTTVKKGDTLIGLLSGFGVPQHDIFALLSAPDISKALTPLVPGHDLKVTLSDAYELETLVYQVDGMTVVHIDRSGENFSLHVEKKTLEAKLEKRSFSINHSLSVDADKAHLPPKLTMQLVDIFGWQIDFARDLRFGDHFEILYETYYLDGKPFKTGSIMAAEFFGHNRNVTAIRYKNDKGRVDYYTPEGKNLRKAFIRKPVVYKRISDPYSPNRMHPVLHVKRPHYGVDMAAPQGTPVRASGDGRVRFAAVNGGYGNLLIIDHGHGITTYYAHLKKFAKNVKKNRYVKQGQVIAYVGSTGLATGPHLHYEYRVNDKPRNPLKVTLPRASSVASTEKEPFEQQVHLFLAELGVDDVSNNA